MAARKKATRKKATRKKATRKKATRKKTARKKAAPKLARVPVRARTAYKLHDDAVEEALFSGEHRDLLEAYFGENGYEELVALKRKARGRARRGGPRVLILPGIMGSKLGTKGALFDDALWLDPLDVVRGNLTDLALGTGDPDVVPLGVILLAYLKLKLQLELRGFDTAFHPFDWRRSLVHLGTELRRRVLEETERHGRVSLVAHSMGGLVSRTALKLLGRQRDKVQRLIMLGTPNFGSFVPAQALRGTYSILTKLDFLDLRHSAEELVNEVFATFPGLYEMLPARAKFSTLDLYDAGTWPDTGPRPVPGLLDGAPAAQERMAPGSERMVMIAGVGQETTTGVELRDGDFQFSASLRGDGTVPLDFALLPGVKQTYYVEESHGSLPNNGKVGRAVAEILERGETSQLDTSWAPKRRVGSWPVRATAAPAAFAGRTRGELGANDYRQLLEEVAAPMSTGAEPTLAPGTALRVFGTSAQPIVVGRRKQHRLDIYLAHGSITQVRTRAIVLGLFRDVEPGGAARAIDAALDGAITEFTTRRMFDGKLGEVFLLPAGQQRIRSELCGFVGLGSFDEFSDDVLRLAAENLVRTLTLTGVQDFATVLIGSGSVTSLRESLRSLVEGVFSGIRDVDARSRLRSVTLCEMDSERYETMRNELLSLSTTSLFDDVEVTLEEVDLPVEPEAPEVTRARLVVAAPEPTYLIMREERSGRRKLDYRASVLTSGGKATVVTDTIEVSRSALEDHLDSIAWLTAGELKAFGAALAGLVLPDSVSQILSRERERPLVVVNDAGTSRIPWETLCLGGWFPAGEAGLVRKYAAENMSVAKWLDERRMGRRLDLLLVVNPTEDLDGAEREGDRVREQFQSDGRVRIHELRGEEATWTALRSAFQSGEFDMVHYAGHAQFDEHDRRRSGLLCHDERLLTGANLAGLSKLPALVFFNACEAARVRGRRSAKRSRTNTQRGTGRGFIDRNVGLAEAFLRGGVANYVGTYWPVGDKGAAVFSAKFYDALLAGRSVGAALSDGRGAVRASRSVDWADYVLYGNPGFVLKVPQ